MSEDGFHVHGAHEHHVEHEAHQGDSLAQRVAVFTAILATLGAFVSFQGGATMNSAMMYKNEAVLKKAEASDQWAFYQAKSTKGNMAEIAAHLAKDPATAELYKKEAERYDKEKKEIKVKAEVFDEESKKANEMSEKVYHPHHQFSARSDTHTNLNLASLDHCANAKALALYRGDCYGRRRRWSLVGIADRHWLVDFRPRMSTFF